MRNPILPSGVYSSMRCVPLVLVCWLAGFAQPAQDPLDAAIQAIWQARTEGRIADIAGARQQARDLLQRVPLDSPRLEGWVSQVSQAYQMSGMNREARTVIEEALARTAPLGNRLPARAALLMALGDSWWRDGNLLKAAEYIDQGAAARLEAPPVPGRSGTRAALFARMGGDFSTVPSGFHAAYEISRLAQLYRELGKPDALAAVAAKLRAMPGSGMALGQLYEQNGDLDQAAKVYRELGGQASDPQTKLLAWQSLSNLEERRKRYAEAADATQQAIAAMESSDQPMFRSQILYVRQTLARQLALAGNKDRGDQLYQQLLHETADPQQATQMALSYAQYLSSTDRPGEAESSLKDYLDRNPGIETWQKSNVLNNLSGIARSRSDNNAADAYQKAAQILQQQQQLNAAVPAPANPIQDAVRAANQALSKQHYEEAYNHTLRALDQASQWRDGQQVVWQVTGVANELVNHKQGAMAEQLFQRLFAVVETWRANSVEPILSSRQAYAQFLLNQPEQIGQAAAAVEQYRSALADANGPESGTLAEALRLQIHSRLDPEQPAKALLEMQAGLSGTTSQPYLRDLVNIARAFTAHNNPRAALPLFRQAIVLTDLHAAINPVQNRSQIRMETAWVLVRLKQFDEAAEMAGEAEAIEPESTYLRQQGDQIRRQAKAAAR